MTDCKYGRREKVTRPKGDEIERMNYDNFGLFLVAFILFIGSAFITFTSITEDIRLSNTKIETITESKNEFREFWAF